MEVEEEGKEGNINSLYQDTTTKSRVSRGGWLASGVRRKTNLIVSADTRFEGSVAQKGRNPALVQNWKNAKVILRFGIRGGACSD